MKYKLLAILIVALGLRLAAVGFGLPHAYHADEPIVVNHALAYGSGDLHPHFFKIPPLVSYLLFGAYGVYYLAGRILGWFASVGDFEALFHTDPTSFYLIARILFGVLPGTLTVLALFRLVRKYTDEATALLSALFLAVCFLHVRDSHYVYADIPLVLVMVVSHFFFLRLPDSKRPLRDHALCGVLIGLAAAVKYNGAVLAVVYLYCSFLGRNKAPLLKAWLVSFAACVGVFLLLNPFSLLDPAFFLKEIRTQSQSQGGVGWTHYFTYSLLGAVGLPWALAAAYGLVKGLCIHRRLDVCFAIFFFVYYGILALAGQPYDRYVLPLLPALAYFAATGVSALATLFGGREKTAAAVLILAVAFLPLVKSLLFIKIMAAEDTRTEAKAWVEENIPAGSKLALGWEFYLPRLRFTKAQLEEKADWLIARGEQGSAKARRVAYLLDHAPAGAKAYELHFLVKNPEEAGDRFLFGRPVVPYDAEALASGGIEYVLFPRIHETPDPPSFFDHLERDWVMVREFNPYRNASKAWPLDRQPLTGGPFLLRDLLERERNGVPIRIYQRKAVDIAGRSAYS